MSVKSSASTLAPAPQPPSPDAASLHISNARRATLLAVFCVAQLLDVVSVSGFFIALAQASIDLKLQLTQSVWIVTAYSITFASFLLLFGRISDLYSPVRVFATGFGVLGVFTLISSFMTDKVAYLVMRALAGIGGAATIPSAINLIVTLYPDPVEQAAGLGMFALTGAIGNAVGVIIAGVTLLASWRWFPRVIAIVALPLSILVLVLLPSVPKAAPAPLIGAEEDDDPTEPRWKKLDFVGSLTMTVALVLFILGMTNGSIDGWSSAGFLAPLLISLLLLVPGFFVFESRLKPSHALFPSSIYRIPNIGALTLASIVPFGFFGVLQTAVATWDQEILHMSGINTAVHLLPVGLVSLIWGGILTGIPKLQSRPQFNIPAGFVLGAVGLVIVIQSDGSNYWRWQFPGLIVSVIGVVMAFAGVNTGLLMSFPPEQAGLAGGIFNMILQIGAVTLLSIQGGLLTTGEGLDDWTSWANGLWMMVAALLASAVAFVLLYRPSKNPTGATVPSVEATAAEAKEFAAVMAV